MSRQLALDTVYLKSTPRLAHTEYSLEYHTDYIRTKTGLDPSDPEAVKRLYNLWDIDFIWHTNDGLHGDWAKFGRTTDMGHAEYAVDGSDKHDPAVCPFNSPEEVWSFDAVSEYGLPDFNEQVAAYENIIQQARQEYPDQLFTGGYYKTIVSGAIQAFGWEMLLLGASNPSKMEKVFDSFFRYTLFHMEAWAKTSVEVIIQHDDFVWASGPFMHPDYYRKVIIPRYAELWKPLHAAGKKVLFCSDGNFMEFAEDIVAAGADGLIFEPCNDFEFMVERFGQDIVLIGSCVDCRDMTFGKWDVVRSQIDRTLELAKHCRGLIFAVGNHLPANIPDDMMDRYIGYLKSHWNK
ncbi:Uroporphyrinogen decarboxylase (URO-D) [Caldanaerobius fijiensis DSM 17918]|uniref:Uroporphyrinogen decarboxylase (URO-D) n=1 Tax=Caldanaerobius fijiensis DSM 17918 TaxID=1121256 RepID=A0A1M4VCD7_9THEO|nr:uroporphyrinogen decarboxylase family protein [Caldanaerobius fijiensis]SHE66538.1 Uroporphyrinogen decarboxylase (URO-D) [Caldanaerobius fijiensis DSM 17918]